MAPEEPPSNTPPSVVPLLNSLAGFGHVGGASLIVVRSMIVGITAAGCFGGVSAILVSGFMGTGALAFLIGSCIGFTGSIWTYYQFTRYRALTALKEHPTLLQLHLRNNFPSERWPKQRLRTLADGGGGMIDESKLVTSWQSANTALEEIYTQREAAIVAESINDSIPWETAPEREVKE